MKHPSELKREDLVKIVKKTLATLYLDLDVDVNTDEDILFFTTEKTVSARALRSLREFMDSYGLEPKGKSVDLKEWQQREVPSGGE